MYKIYSNKHKEHYSLSFVVNKNMEAYDGLLTYFDEEDKLCKNDITRTFDNASKEDIVSNVISELEDRGDVITVYGLYPLSKLRYIDVHLYKKVGEKIETHLRFKITYFRYSDYLATDTPDELDNVIKESLETNLSFDGEMEISFGSCVNDTNIENLTARIPELRDSSSIQPLLKWRFCDADENGEKSLKELSFKLTCVINSFKNESSLSLIPTTIYLLELNDKQSQLIKGLIQDPVKEKYLN